MRNPATGRQCYGGMVPLEQLEEYEPSAPLPPPEPIPTQVSRRTVLALPERTDEEPNA